MNSQPQASSLMPSANTAPREDLFLANGRLVLPDQVMLGAIRIVDGMIVEITEGDGVPNGAVDCQGDFILPGLVELHTDNVERHIEPRPGVDWPHLSALLAHDAELASTGITTVFDAMRVGSLHTGKAGYSDYARKLADEMLDARGKGMFKISHFLHLRAEICSETLLDEFAMFGPQDRVGIVSLMDHTPGQRQWRDTTTLKAFMRRRGLTEQEAEDSVQNRINRGSRHTPANWKAVLELFADQNNVTLATHDDTTIDDIDMGAEAGIKISEFPCSLEAARHAHTKGMTTIGGAPNIVRGGSHSGNVAILDLAKAGVLDALSSDYVPGSLLQAVFKLTRELDQPLYETIKLITRNTAHMVGLTDRGELAVGKRSDVVRLKDFEGTPIVREVYAQGRRVT